MQFVLYFLLSHLSEVTHGGQKSWFGSNQLTLGPFAHLTSGFCQSNILENRHPISTRSQWPFWRGCSPRQDTKVTAGRSDALSTAICKFLFFPHSAHWVERNKKNKKKLCTQHYLRLSGFLASFFIY